MGKPKATDILNILIAILFLTVGGISLYVIVNSKAAQNVKLFKKPAQNFNVGWYYIAENGNNIYIPSLPAKIPCESDGTARIYHNYAAHEQKTLCFFTHHQNAAFYIDGKKIYSYELKGNPPWLKCFRAIYHIVDIPASSNGTISLEIKGLIKNRNGEFNEIYMGDRAENFYRLMINRPDKLYLGITLTIFGLLVTLLGLATIARVGNEKWDLGMVYLGLTALCLGIWQLEESRVLQFFFGSQALHWCLEYMLQFFIIGFALKFLQSMATGKMTVVTNIFTAIVLITATVQIGLQLAGIMQITSSSFMLYIMYIGICIFIALLILITMKFSNKILKVLFFSSMGLSVITFFTVMLLGSTRSKNSTDFWLSVGLTFMFFSLAVVVYQKTVEKFEKIREAKLYEKLALVDFNTGVSSKTAWFYLVEQFDYNQHLGKIYCLILFDMNNLKKLNDTQGHLVGDKVINAFCDCMRMIFGSKGEIYRIGGDEFICLLSDIDEDGVKKLLKEFDESVANQKETEYRFTVAYGWSIFKPKSRADFIAAQERADSLMYDMKRRMKAEAGNTDIRGENAT